MRRILYIVCFVLAAAIGFLSSCLESRDCPDVPELEFGNYAIVDSAGSPPIINGNVMISREGVEIEYHDDQGEKWRAVYRFGRPSDSK